MINSVRLSMAPAVPEAALKVSPVLILAVSIAEDSAVFPVQAVGRMFFPIFSVVVAELISVKSEEIFRLILKSLLKRWRAESKKKSFYIKM